MKAVNKYNDLVRKKNCINYIIVSQHVTLTREGRT